MIKNNCKIVKIIIFIFFNNYKYLENLGFIVIIIVKLKFK